MAIGDRDRRLTLLRRSEGDSAELGERQESWGPSNPPEKVWASREDVSDGEVARAGAAVGTRRARFQVPASPRTRSMTQQDRLRDSEGDWAIVGIKQVDGKNMLEWTADRRPLASL